MNFAKEGLPFIAVAALVAVGTYAVALNRRSWPWWLLAFPGVLIVATVLALTTLGEALRERLDPRS